MANLSPTDPYDRFTAGRLKDLLDEACLKYNTPAFIEEDPVSVPHRFSSPEDIEISGFFAALFAWGRRSVIVEKTNTFIRLMDNAPYDFILHFEEKDLNKFLTFRYRTFQYDDTLFFLKTLQQIYREHGGLQGLFSRYYAETMNLLDTISLVRKLFIEFPHLKRTEKHFADPGKGSAAKRLNMFLRWMVRKDGKGVDFGLWKNIPPSALFIPLDLHAGHVSRKLGLLTRRNDDRKAVEELTYRLRHFDADDPVKYDYALFGLGWYENFR